MKSTRPNESNAFVSLFFPNALISSLPFPFALHLRTDRATTMITLDMASPLKIMMTPYVT